MTRSEYRKARAMLRANGTHAFRWMDAHIAAIMFALHKAPGDLLALRVSVARCERAYGASYLKASRFALLVTRGGGK